MKFYDRKLILAGSSAKILVYDKPVAYGFSVKKKTRKDKEPSTNILSPKEITDRAKTQIRRKVRANAWQHINPKNGKPYLPQFFTLTFNYESVTFDESHPVFRNFIRKLGRNIGHSPYYLCVPEFQKDVDFYGKIKPNGGNVHYHVLIFNLPYVENIKDEIAKVWGNGFIKGRSFSDANHAANYVCKYIGKELDNKHIKFRKRYFCSKHLLKQKEFKNPDFVDPYAKYLLEHPNAVIGEIKKYKNNFGIDITEQSIEFPNGFNLDNELVKNCLMDTEVLAKRIFGVK
jgi:hypothetical protein